RRRSRGLPLLSRYLRSSRQISRFAKLQGLWRRTLRPAMASGRSTRISCPTARNGPEGRADRTADGQPRARWHAVRRSTHRPRPPWVGHCRLRKAIGLVPAARPADILRSWEDKFGARLLEAGIRWHPAPGRNGSEWPELTRRSRSATVV